MAIGLKYSRLLGEMWGLGLTCDVKVLLLSTNLPSPPPRTQSIIGGLAIQENPNKHVQLYMLVVF